MMISGIKKSAVTALLAIVVTGCWQGNKQTVVADDVSWYENDSALWKDLATAIEDAKQVDSSKIRPLMPIRKDYPGQEWVNIDGHDMVLVVISALRH